ncbi:phosphoribosylglycinamide formyltransferase [Pajaroellobacter abortibovis]|uniref:Phosphoribosylglycinamide formyltransferase n=1 Tax=Pajaroellobacter abortibovis TaxID=1882918 RepID=A0A1L6MVP8_9BACT|nr:phosphoribosylglycinamide formyltransferase [Pajaroellobacter abortibovis]APR99596.1 phosphoribosylglycinamide formyltransferase [Pajaroellobacter abortibovis]
MLKLGVLLSGRGTNLQAIVDAIEAGRLNAKICTVISNVAGVHGLERAREAGILHKVIDHRAYPDRQAFEEALLKVLRREQVEYVVLAGFMRILTPFFLEAFSMRIINIHPSLLPAFPGIDAQAAAFRYGVRISGCTVHFVDQSCDGGPIIAQVAVPVLSDDSEETLAARILAAEHQLLPQVLQWIAEGRVRIENAFQSEKQRPRVLISPS